jgi:hypothetical protein
VKANILSAENASMERILSRIDQTAIHEIKQVLMQHLDETFHQNVRLECILKNQIYQNWTDKN